MTTPRIVITGTGAVTPIGIGVDAFWSAALAGQNGLRDIERFDTSDLRARRAGEVLDFYPADFMSKSQVEATGRTTQLAIAAAQMARDEADGAARSLSQFCPRDRSAICMGTIMGEPEILMGIAQHYNDARNEAAEDLLLQLPSSLIATHVADAMNFCGPCYQIPTACAAGNYAISYAADLLRLQRADFVLAGGADALSRIAVVGFNKLLACATDMVRPFDLNRQGMMNAEGAGFLALERLESAERRGANILAEFIDYGVGCDAYKVTIPHPQGRGGVLALQRALSRSQLATTAVDYISAHGTGTKENDRIETAVIKQVLGDHAHRTKISSLKSMIGHTMGAASAIEAVACVKVVQQGRIPPTINLTTADPECDLDYVPNVFCEHPVNVAVSNAYAFGGNCSSIVIQRWTAMA